MAQTKHRDDQLFVAPVEFGAAVVRKGRELFVPAGNAAAGATAGWVVTGADDGLARLPASQTNSTLVIPLKGMRIGDTLTGLRVIGQVESAGADVTLVLSARKATAAAADFADVELDTANVGTLTADTLIAGAVLEVTGLAEVLAETELLYALITGTTAALTDIALSGIVATVTES